jgi:hypothetical protein
LLLAREKKNTQKCVEIKLFCFPKEKEKKKRKISEKKKTMEGGIERQVER